MHACPRCGFDCDCSGDWDDCDVMSTEWVFKNCQCDCEYGGDPDDDDYEDEDWEDDDWENDETEFNHCEHCDLPDACEDFGCAIKSGVRKHPDVQ